MKCPKCGYLGFETTDRCRHCGYDFSLSAPVEPVSELPLRSGNEPEAAFADLALDRMIGQPDGGGNETPPAVTPPADILQREFQSESDAAPLPLFTRGRSDRDAPPLMTTPPPAGPPLAVRRATPEVARRRTPRTLRRDNDALDLQLESAASSSTPEEPVAVGAAVGGGEAAAPKLRRVAAALLDLALLAGINAAVLYLTVAIAGLAMQDVFILPRVPMGAFLMLLNAGYLVAFTAANGQTIGKMLFGVRVIGDDYGRVDVAGAVIRAAGVVLTLVTLGLAYLPVLVSRDGRALHDRLAGTRVIKHA